MLGFGRWACVGAAPDPAAASPAVPAVSLTNFDPGAIVFTGAPPASVLLGTETNAAVADADGSAAGFNVRLAAAIYFGRTRQTDKARAILIGLLSAPAPVEVQQSALFELAGVARGDGDLSRAASIYAQFLDRWPKDPRVPEIILRQGQVFREMGLNSMALAKFYAVMTAALSLKDDQLSYYQRLVLQAQMEIAETQYQAGRYADAAEFYSRLLKQDNPALDRPQIQFRLIRSLTGVGRNEDAAGQAEDFLARYANAPEEPEVRFSLAQTLKELGRNSDALQQVLLLLQEEKAKTRDHPEVWAYWQQRAGNEIANQLYREGDYLKALDVYNNLVQLDPAPAWQVPVQYQIGITYERLLQPQKAVDTYHRILQRQADLGTNAPPSLAAIFDMARWRIDFIAWQTHAELSDRLIAATVPAFLSATNAPARAALP